MNITFTEDDRCFPPLWSVYYILYGILVFLGNQLVYFVSPNSKIHLSNHHDHHQTIMIIVINDSSSLSSSCNANTSSVSTRKPPPANMFVGLALAYIVIDIIIIFVIINLRNITFPFFVKWSLLVWFETSQSDCESLWHLGRGLASKWNDTNTSS